MLKITYTASDDDIVESFVFDIHEVCGHGEKSDIALGGEAHGHDALF